MDSVDNPELSALWNRVVRRLMADGLSGYSIATLNFCHPIALDDGRLTIGAPHDPAAELLRTRLREPMTNALTAEFQQTMSFSVVVDHALQDAPSSVQPQPAPAQPTTPTPRPTSIDVTDRQVGSEHRTINVNEQAAARPRIGPGAHHPMPQPHQRRNDHQESWSNGHSRPRLTVPDDSQLNESYTFETFVRGESNRFASAAALSVAESPACVYNPLFIYGPSGLGKTHMLHAIGNYARQLYPEARVVYVNSEVFTNDFINAIRNETKYAFQQRYREVDWLLIDDIQFLQGKEETQQEFFNTFNALHVHRKQVVITSDMPPKALSGFADRMVSRFEAGLLADVQPPSLETRVAILRKKAEQDLTLSCDDDVLVYIAERVTRNIRELEGALTRVSAFASLNPTARVDRRFAEETLADIITQADEQEVSVAVVMSLTAEYCGVTVADLKSPSRSRKLAEARQIAMYLTREMTEMSLPKIGQEFGNRDHTTVMHAVKKITEQLQKDRQLYNQVNELTARIRNNVGGNR